MDEKRRISGSIEYSHEAMFVGFLEFRPGNGCIRPGDVGECEYRISNREMSNVEVEMRDGGRGGM